MPRCWVAGGEGNESVDARTLAVNAETWEGEGVAAVGALGAAGTRACWPGWWRRRPRSRR